MAAAKKTTTTKAPAKRAAKKQEPTLELREDGFWWYGDTNLGRNRRYAEAALANQ